MNRKAPQTGRVTVRPAVDDDIDPMCALYDEFHEFHVEGVPDRLASLRPVSSESRTRLVSRLREIMTSEDSALLVAEADRALVALAEVYIRDDHPDPARIARRFGHLQSMVVASEHRRSGMGKLLLNASEAWALDRGASEMRLDVWEFRRGPLRFYERCGYRTLRRMLVRQLG